MNLKERIRDEIVFFSAFSNIRTKVEDIVVEGNKVAFRVALHCKHTGEYQGIRATNRPVTIRYMEILLLEDGKIIKEWAEFDLTSILNQLN